MSTSQVITQCDKLKDPSGVGSTTILTLANDTNLNGRFFGNKTGHWSWWVFPSATGNTSYKQFDFNDTSPIYQSIANDDNYLTAYTKVLGYITDEIKTTPVSVAQHIDFTKAVRCYYRIYLQTKNDHSKDSFNNQFLAFCDELKKSKNTILHQQRQYHYNYFSNNKQLIDKCCEFSSAQTIDDIPNINNNTPPPINPQPVKQQKLHHLPFNPLKQNDNFTPTIKNQPLPTYPVNQKQPVQPQLQQSQMPFIPQSRYTPHPFYGGITYCNSYIPAQKQPIIDDENESINIDGKYNQNNNTSHTSKITILDVLLCIILPIIWWVVVARKIRNNKPRTNLQSVRDCGVDYC